MKEFLNINELSEYLGIKKSTLYAKVSSHEITHYKIGRLVRFKKADIDRWIEVQKMRAFNPQSSVQNIISHTQDKSMDIDRIIQKSVEQMSGKGYKFIHRETRPKSLKGGHNGTL